jgi:hypothetical protein
VPAKKKPLRPEQWLKRLPPPSRNNLALERLFLEDHWRYGGLIHKVTADALVEALSKPSDISVGHGLFLRLFSEYATVLETLGAWGWTMRNRRDYPTLLDGFLAYGHNDPRAFFTSVKRSRSRSLRLLLRLPAERKLSAAARAGFGYASDDEVRAAFGECFAALGIASTDYFAADEVIRTAYNKAKHGGTMFRLADDDPRTFRVLMPHLLVTSAKDTTRYNISKFTVNKTMIRNLQKKIEIESGALRFLQGLARALHQANALY